MADNRSTACDYLKLVNAAGAKPTPIKSLKNFYQVAISNRHQQYVADFNADTMV